MSDRTCAGCGGLISGRRRRCEACRKQHRAAGMRARRAAESGEPTSVLADDAPVVDLTGGSSKPPDFPGVRKAPQPQYAEPEVVDYTRGGFTRPGMYQPRNALAQVPGAVRHDLVKAQQMARDLAAADDEPDLASWNEMNTPPAEQAWRVSFGRSASFYEQPTVTPSPYADAILGQAVRVSRPRPPRPNLAAPQKTPAIIVN
jgi:hypothetical protein